MLQFDGNCVENIWDLRAYRVSFAQTAELRSHETTYDYLCTYTGTYIYVLHH